MGQTPHEKQPSAESDDRSGEAASSSVTVPTGSQFSNKVSKSDAADCSCATSVGGHIAAISCWMRTLRRSRSDGIGTACGGGSAGVGNNFLMMFSTVSVSGDVAGAGSISAQGACPRSSVAEFPLLGDFPTPSN